jgi:small subunit ribosomal protein S2
MKTEELFKNFVHIGHRTDLWNPKMKPFIYGQVEGIHIFDLEKTIVALEKAKNLIAATKLKNGKILFVGTKPQVSFVLKQKLETGKHFFIDEKWCPGLLTNFGEVRHRINHYLNLKSQFESGEIKKYTKKEVAKFKKELEKLNTRYHGVAEMRKAPDLLVVFDSVGNKLAIAEANTLKIPVIGVVDSNADPDNISFPIPANDDSVHSIGFLCDTLLQSTEEKKSIKE